MQAADHLSSPRPPAPPLPTCYRGKPRVMRDLNKYPKSEETADPSGNSKPRDNNQHLKHICKHGRKSLLTIMNVFGRSSPDHRITLWCRIGGIAEPVSRALVPSLTWKVEKQQQQNKPVFYTTVELLLTTVSQLARLNQRFSESPAQRRVERQKGARPGFTAKCS